jgi:phosphoglycerol transferase MdoB-like AlkP superfamily enzyme
MQRSNLINEYLIIIYRFSLMLLLYSVCRVGFYLFNTDLFPNITFAGFLTIMKGGLIFDISALLYINLLYILLCLIPLRIKFKHWYQTTIKWLFIITNAIGLATNVIDFIFYQYTLKRTSFSVFELFANEGNIGILWLRFLYDYWYAFLFWIILVTTMYFLYGILKPKPLFYKNRWVYGLSGLVFLTLFTGLAVIGIRGGYRHSTRPINMSNAGKYVNAPEEMALVLNTPFSVLRTMGKTTFKPIQYFTDEEAELIYSPVHHPADSLVTQEMNVMIIILESFSREHSGLLNQHLDNGSYKGYTPFLDSLISVSYSFTNAFANGRKSIDAMPSILASIPALVQPFVVSEYSTNRINGLGTLLREKGYHTSFFHGAPNGSMGFDSFAKLSGFDHYYGRDEYGYHDFDGLWGVWDKPFFQFVAQNLNTFPEPFTSALFSVSSHHPFKIPKQYENYFPKGTLPVHQCVGYTDMALKEFFNTVSEMEWYDRTLFVITADHSVKGHYSEYNNNINAFAVPLLFYAPGMNLKGYDNGLAQQTDILPTILNILGYDRYFVAFGNNLLIPDNKHERFVLNYISETFQFLKDEWAIYFDGQEVVAFYNVESDPLLANNLKDKEPVPHRYLDLMKAVIQQYNNRMIENRLRIPEKVSP